MHFEKYEWFTLSLYCYAVLHGISNHYQTEVGAIQPQLEKITKIYVCKDNVHLKYTEIGRAHV